MHNADNQNLGGCALSQEGSDFYIVGADAVRKKLGEMVTKTVSGSQSNFSPDYVERSIFIDIPTVPGYQYKTCALVSCYCANSNGALKSVQFEIEKYSDTQIRVYGDRNNTNWNSGGCSAAATVIIFYD